ncbi:IQ domain-containing protein E isoform X2 [Phyllostomus hastatus]|uniref:IQ domain-containing protein E isoform X2 n=1 Tax=Phyllostomus hastatus TaxID=9423 RepID=UPI001E67ED74|nr:IQ domain-containing protein E isoform X2 [Phyllostomus hastatus]
MRTVGRGRARRHIRGSAGPRGCHGSGVAAGARTGPGCWRPGGPRSPGAGRPGSAAAMSLGTGDPGSETGDDSLSAITLDSDCETTTKRRSVHRPPPTSPKSPYSCQPRAVPSWRSLRTAASLPLSRRTTFTPQQLWPGSAKPGSAAQPPKPGLTLERPWAHPLGSAPDPLTEALRAKRSNLRRSASNGHVPGTPIYREKEDMYDEIIELKKSLHVQKGEADQLRTRLRRLEEENARKDRQIEQLLGPARGPDFVWTPADKRPDTSWVVNGLRQRVLKLEQQCKDRDSTISKLQADMKTTNLEEMRVAMETYYEEIYRLQTLLARSETTGRKPPAERKPSLRRQRKLSSALLSLSRSVQELTEENQSLKEDLDRVLSSSPSAARRKGYAEWSKSRLLRRIAELEKMVSAMEGPEPQAAAAGPQGPRALSAFSSSPQPLPRTEDSESLQGAVSSLQGEREALEAQLQERDLEVRQLLQAKADLEKALEDLRGGERARSEREEALREEIQALTKKFQDLEAAKQEEEGGRVGLAPEAREQPGPPRPAGSPPQQQHPEPEALGEDSAQPPGPRVEGREQAAARALQARWKVYRRQKEKAALDEVRKAQAATALQAAFRGHLARARLLLSRCPGTPGLPSQSSPAACLPSPTVHAEGDPGQEVAITLIQSVLRAHLARAGHSPRTRAEAPSKRSAASAPRCGAASPAPATAPAGREDSGVSPGDTVRGPAAEAGGPRSWELGTPAAPQPRSPAESPPHGVAAPGAPTAGRRLLRRLRRGGCGSVSGCEERRPPAAWPGPLLEWLPQRHRVVWGGVGCADVPLKRSACPNRCSARLFVGGAPSALSPLGGGSAAPPAPGLLC